VVEGLIWALAIYAIGGVLVLERHCLGQRALVQPLTLCLIAGLLSDHVETGIWIGVTLQLLSVAPSRSVDWALSGAVAAVLLVTAPKLGYKIESGDVSASLLALVSVLSGLASRSVERWYAKTDLGKIQGHPPWKELDPVRAMERTVYRAIARWLVVDGVEVILGVGFGLAAIAATHMISPNPHWLTAACAVALPTFGVAVVASALVEYRFIAWSGISMGFSILLLSVVLR
jgi:mannose/fructose/N-acetylgalactosamine-specific phosphotransferase system component IIC